MPGVGVHCGAAGEERGWGVIIVVMPGRLGLAIFAPLLDERGNSVRGVRACAALAERYGLDRFGGAVAGLLDSALGGRVAIGGRVRLGR